MQVAVLQDLVLKIESIFVISQWRHTMLLATLVNSSSLGRGANITNEQKIHLLQITAPLGRLLSSCCCVSMIVSMDPALQD